MGIELFGRQLSPMWQIIWVRGIGGGGHGIFLSRRGILVGRGGCWTLDEVLQDEQEGEEEGAPTDCGADELVAF